MEKNVEDDCLVMIEKESLKKRFLTSKSKMVPANTFWKKKSYKIHNNIDFEFLIGPF